MANAIFRNRNKRHQSYAIVTTLLVPPRESQTVLSTFFRRCNPTESRLSSRCLTSGIAGFSSFMTMARLDNKTVLDTEVLKMFFREVWQRRTVCVSVPQILHTIEGLWKLDVGFSFYSRRLSKAELGLDHKTTVKIKELLTLFREWVRQILAWRSKIIWQLCSLCLRFS